MLYMQLKPDPFIHYLFFKGKKIDFGKLIFHGHDIIATLLCVAMTGLFSAPDAILECRRIPSKNSLPTPKHHLYLRYLYLKVAFTGMYCKCKSSL